MTEKQRAIFEIQSYLRNIARTDSDILLIIPDGIFGVETADSVKSFQRKWNIEETGVVDYETWTRIVQENRVAVFLASEPLPLGQVSGGKLPLKIGMKDSSVIHLKTMLLYLGQKHSNFSTIAVDDEFDTETEKSVRQWQRVIRAPETGEVDKLTWNRLVEYYILN